MTALPEEIIVEILSQSPAPLERRLSKSLDRKYRDHLSRIRERRYQQLMAPYQSTMGFEIIKDLIVDNNLEGLRYWYWRVVQEPITMACVRQRRFVSPTTGIVRADPAIPRTLSLVFLGIRRRTVRDPVDERLPPDPAHLAAKLGHLEILQWFYSIDLFPNHHDVAILAAVGSHLPVLKWLHSLGLKLDHQRLNEYCLRYGRIEIMRWLNRTLDSEFPEIAWLYQPD